MLSLPMGRWTQFGGILSCTPTPQPKKRTTGHGRTHVATLKASPYPNAYSAYGRYTDPRAPTDALEPGDLAQLVGCAFLWHSQQEASIPQAEISLIVLAPGVNEAVRDEVQAFGWQIGEHEAGVHRITGGPFTMWLVETDVMAKRG